MSTIWVVGLGPAGREYVTAEAIAQLESGKPVFVRTRRHPSATIVPDSARTFDDIYEACERIEDVYEEITSVLLSAVHEYGDIVYAVPGSPLVAERTVVLLRELANNTNDVDVRIVPAMSFLDLVWNAIGIDPLEVQPRIVDGHRFATDAVGEHGPLLVAQCDSSYVLSEIKLAFEDDAKNEPPDVIVMQRLGLDDQNVRVIPLHQLDRTVKPDHLTTLWFDRLPQPVAPALARVAEVARRLRQDCPWDAEQTHLSLRKHAIEEVYELADAIHAAEANDASAEEHLIEELGDVFFQVFAHAAIAEEQGRFTIADVANGLCEKLILRHPHVYGDAVASTADEVLATWESNKRKEKQRTGVFDGVPRDLPALALAAKALSRAEHAGMESVQPREGDAVEGALGETLLALVADAKRDGLDAEDELRQATLRFMAAVEQAHRSDALASRA